MYTERQRKKKSKSWSSAILSLQYISRRQVLSNPLITETPMSIPIGAVNSNDEESYKTAPLYHPQLNVLESSSSPSQFGLVGEEDRKAALNAATKTRINQSASEKDQCPRLQAQATQGVRAENHQRGCACSD